MSILQNPCQATQTRDWRGVISLASWNVNSGEEYEQRRPELNGIGTQL